MSVKETIYEKGHQHEPSPVSASLTTFAVLAGLAVVALMIGFNGSGPSKVYMSLGVATIQSCVLSYYFMDLRKGDTVTWLCAGASIFWTMLLFLFTLTDYLTRHYATF